MAANLAGYKRIKCLSRKSNRVADEPEERNEDANDKLVIVSYILRYKL